MKRFEKVSVSLVGPCLEDYGSIGPGDTRHVAVEIALKPEGALWSGDEVEYQLDAREWPGEAPTIRYGMANYGRILDLATAERAVKRLKTLGAYIRRLPVPPRTLNELVTVVMSHHGVRPMDMVEVLAYQDHRTRPHLRDSISREQALRLVEKAAEELAKGKATGVTS